MKKITLLFTFLCMVTISSASFGTTPVVLNGTESVAQLNVIISTLQTSIQGLQIKQAGLNQTSSNKPDTSGLQNQLDSLKADYKAAFDNAEATKKTLAEAQADFESKSQEQDKLLSSIKKNKTGAIVIASTAVVVGAVAVAKNNQTRTGSYTNFGAGKPVPVTTKTEKALATTCKEGQVIDHVSRKCGAPVYTPQQQSNLSKMEIVKDNPTPATSNKEKPTEIKEKSTQAASPLIDTQQACSSGQKYNSSKKECINLTKKEKCKKENLLWGNGPDNISVVCFGTTIEQCSRIGGKWEKSAWKEMAGICII